MKTKTDPLIGKFFHAFNRKGELTWQGQVVASFGDGNYLAETYSWADGHYSCEHIFHITHTYTWCFHRTAEELQNCGKSIEGNESKAW